MMFIFNYEILVDPLLRDLRKFTPEFPGFDLDSVGTGGTSVVLPNIGEAIQI